MRFCIHCGVELTESNCIPSQFKSGRNTCRKCAQDSHFLYVNGLSELPSYTSCRCGCGRTDISRNGYCIGHWAKDKTLSVAIREKIAKANMGKHNTFSCEGQATHRFYGKKNQSKAAASRRGVRLTREQRQKIADATRNAMATLPEESRLRMLHTHLGSHRTEATKIKQRLYHQSIEGREAGRKGALKTPLVFQDTSIEIKLQNALRIHNIAFRTHVACGDICVPDIQLLDYKIVIFADGCYWHGCPVHYPLVKRRRHQDAFINNFLSRRGWKVFRFWEHEINEDVDCCVKEVLSFIGFRYVDRIPGLRANLRAAEAGVSVNG